MTLYIHVSLYIYIQNSTFFYENKINILLPTNYLPITRLDRTVLANKMFKNNLLNATRLIASWTLVLVYDELKFESHISYYSTFIMYESH